MDPINLYKAKNFHKILICQVSLKRTSKLRHDCQFKLASSRVEDVHLRAGPLRQPFNVAVIRPF